MKKINEKVILIVVIWLLVIGLLVYSRFINLGWGFPYPMHPDERNMANAIQQLSCEFSSASWQTNFQNCFNPRFFAYGQFPLYLGYLVTYFLKFFDGDLGFPIGFQEAAISLRIISAVASIISAIIIIKIIKVINKKESYLLSLISYLLIIFSPYAIQFAHFGTTESLLMLFYSLIIYLSMLTFERRTTDAVVWLGLVSGLAVATKISSVLFLTVPVYVFISKIKYLLAQASQKSKTISKFKTFNLTLGFALCTLIFALVFSSHNFINFKDFISSVNYESDVALGKSLVFYTRQFFDTIPVWFQLTKVFPYVLGWPVFILGLIGLIRANWRDKKINLLRFAFLIYFIPSAVIYAKWSRFMAPVLPLMLILSILFLFKLKNWLFDNSWINSKFRIQNSKVKVKSQKFFIFYFLISFLTFAFLLLTCIVPGIAYLQVYQNPDVRFQASDWIYKNIPSNSYILSETANVVDIPLEVSSYKVHQVYQVISFNFYDLDESLALQLELKDHLEKADYIFVPSRRIFANHSKKKYPILNKYYEDLFSGKLGFEKVAEFESFPKVCLPFDKNKCLVFEDEQTEETWTVFDHPVIRIYKKVK
ncbi:MAG: glycosyltransferase family 39 protein [Patescibacteria group bacterium]